MAENKKFTRLINSDGTKQAVALDMVSFDEQTKKLTLYSSVDDTIKEETIIPASEVDATLSQSGLAADAKATGDAVKDVVKVGGTASGFTGIIVGTGEEEIELVEQKDFDAEIAKLNAKVGTPLVANAASAMVDTTKIYVYTGNENGYVNGNWYFYNGTNWESGGVYNAVAVQTDKTLTQENKAADGKAVGDELGSLKSDLGTGFFNNVDYGGDANDLGAGVARTLPTATNIPFAVVGYVVTFARTASTAKAQLFINAQNGSVAEQSRLFSRFLANGSWTPWIEYTNRTDIWTNSNDYSGDVNNAEFGMTRVSATAAHNPGGTIGFLITYERAASSKMQIFVTTEMLYFRTSSSSVWDEWQSISRWKTDLKTGYTFGDSLMAQDGAVYAYQDPQYNTDEIGHTCVGWQTHLRKNFGVTITNYAVGGQDILHQKDAIMSKDYSNVDFVIISTGMNDYSSSVPMGTLPTSKTPVYTSGAFIDTYCQCLDYIFTSNPKVKVLLFTPTQRDTTWRNGGTPDISIYASDIFTPNSQGLYLKDYANAIKQIGEQYGCVVCDLYGQSGLNYMTLPEYTFEGVHPTNDGYKYTMPVVNDAFNKL